MFSEDDRFTCEYCGRTTFTPVEIDRDTYTLHFCSEECAHSFETQPLDEPTPSDIQEYFGY